jgi:hypothetical protein
MALTGSVVSYPDRGNYGRASYRGNTSGRLLVDLFETFRPSVVCDPAEGGGTTGDVCAALNRRGFNIEYHGFDLSRGFDLLSNSLSERLTRPADLIFFHPPYHDMVTYSGEVWGAEAHPNDLSRCASYEEFLSKLQRALYNIYEGVERGGRYAVQIGDLRRAGSYYAMQAHLIAIAPGLLENVIIKQQHNTTSGRRTYSSPVVRIEHEYVCTFRRDGIVFGAFDATLAASERLRMFSNCTWRAIVEFAFAHFGGRASLEQLYQFIEEKAHSRIKSKHWKEKIRQTVQRVAVNIERGLWATASGQQTTGQQSLSFAA